MNQISIRSGVAYGTVYNYLAKAKNNFKYLDEIGHLNYHMTINTINTNR
ncbi:hypothetical protein SAMN04487995_1776 [Dyadobacter koreensis]|uniref:Uncharacterized protein n=1 Tax=Dyadobacter koreensis TaxID=408657 RepID=A0A1H6SQK4_9BACT|nr:hypothetical protein SAMN04487995_1776 [Dyadobacter koreensis]